MSALASDNGSAPKSFDYDLLIIGAGVGGHGAALHAVEKVRFDSFRFGSFSRGKCGFELVIFFLSECNFLTLINRKPDIFSSDYVLILSKFILCNL